MSRKGHIIHSMDQAAELHEVIVKSASMTMQWIASYQGDPMAFLKAFRFEKSGHDPLTGRKLNAVEQLNQTFTILVSLRAVEMLFSMHPEANGFELAFGTAPGYDIRSVAEGVVAAEAFAATHPRSNRKLAKDTNRMAEADARNRYVFFFAPGYPLGRCPALERVPGVHVYAVDL